MLLLCQEGGKAGRAALHSESWAGWSPGGKEHPTNSEGTSPMSWEQARGSGARVGTVDRAWEVASSCLEVSSESLQLTEPSVPPEEGTCPGWRALLIWESPSRVLWLEGKFLEGAILRTEESGTACPNPPGPCPPQIEGSPLSAFELIERLREGAIRPLPACVRGGDSTVHLEVVRGPWALTQSVSTDVLQLF